MIGFWVTCWFFFGPRLRLGHVLVRVTTCVKNREISGLNVGRECGTARKTGVKKPRLYLCWSLFTIYVWFVLCVSVPSVCLCHAVVHSTSGPVLAAHPRKAMPWRLAGVIEICHTPWMTLAPLPQRINASMKRAGAVTLHEPNGSYFTTDQQVKLKCVICCCSASGHDAKRLGNGLEKSGKFYTLWCEKWLLGGLLIKWLHCHCCIALVWVDDAIKIQLLWRNVVQF